VAIHTALNCRLMQRPAAQQPQHHHLLNRPAIPPPWRDTFRQPRTGLAATLAQEPRDRDRIQRTARPGPSIRLALITAMPPKPPQATMRTGCRPVNQRFSRQRFEVLWKRKNRWHNPRHRLVSSAVEKGEHFPR
jgi:hypothetical protein